MKGKTKKETNVPNLRFKEFEGEWEVLLFRNIVQMNSGGTPPMQSQEYWGGDIPFISAASMHNVFISRSNQYITQEGLKNGSKLLKKGNLLLLVRGSMLWNRIPICYNTVDVAFNQDVKGLVTSDRVSALFMLYWLQSKEAILKYKVTGTGIGAGKLESDDISDLLAIIPQNAEQSKIQKLFGLIDHRISTQRKIIDELKVLKTAVARKVFFKRGEWEVKKLGEIADIKRGASPRPISNPEWFDENSEIGWVRISDVTKSNKYLEKTEQYLSNEGISRSRLVQRNSLIMSICATIGKPIYTKFDVCIHDGFVVFENLNLNKEYLYYYLDFIQDSWYRYGQPGTQINLNTEIVNNEEIQCPPLTEQTRIAQCLSAIDQKIELETTVFKKLTQQKGYFLQQMFI